MSQKELHRIQNFKKHGMPCSAIFRDIEHPDFSGSDYIIRFSDKDENISYERRIYENNNVTRQYTRIRLGDVSSDETTIAPRFD